MTLFLGRYVEPVPPERRKGVLFVDVPPEAEALIPDHIRSRAERLTNTCPPSSIRDDPLADGPASPRSRWIGCAMQSWW